MRRRAALVAATLMAGCEWFSTMADPASIQPHETEPRLPPEHAVALGGLPEFDIVTAEQTLTNPQPPDSASLAIGEAYFRNFCQVCHGEGGMGTGPLATKFPAIPAINTARVAGYSDAYVFALISKGRGLMPDYGRIPAAARWDVVNYVRTLGPRAAGAPGGGADTTAVRGGP